MVGFTTRAFVPVATWPSTYTLIAFWNFSLSQNTIPKPKGNPKLNRNPNPVSLKIQKSHR